ncbi:MAG: SpoIIE family protein phosphatase [Thermodesulfobacteriota bacterium]
MPFKPFNVPAETILDHTNDGIYVVDPDCRILYWNRPAEHITGWKAEEVIGRRCRDDVLVHVDRFGQELCEPGRCPLHRSMAEGRALSAPFVVYAKRKDGERVPVAVSVAPLYGDQGQVIGGVEVFRDESELIADMERARLAQLHALSGDLPSAPAEFKVLYRPHEMVGGDYYRVEALPDGRVAFMLADVAGHGVAAALYTMTLRALWEEHREFLVQPDEVLVRLNRALDPLTTGDSFTTAFLGLLDPRSGELAYASAGAPPALLRGRDGQVRTLQALDLPLGMLPVHQFRLDRAELEPGGLLLLCSDGAIEAHSPGGEEFGLARLTELVATADPGRLQALLDRVEQGLLDHVESVRLPDDLALLAIGRPV